VACQVKQKLHSMQFLTVLRDSAEIGKAPSLRNILHQENKAKTKQNASAGQTTETMTTSEQHLISRVVAGGIGLLQALQDDVHRL
jgi:hypothetical protein